MPDPGALTGQSYPLWHLRSGVIDELVRAADQFDAWDTLRDRPAEDFGHEFSERVRAVKRTLADDDQADDDG